VHKQLRRLPLSILAKLQISVFPLAGKKKKKRALQILGAHRD
jgi:hypothetical protein